MSKILMTVESECKDKGLTILLDRVQNILARMAFDDADKITVEWTEDNKQCGMQWNKRFVKEMSPEDLRELLNQNRLPPEVIEKLIVAQAKLKQEGREVK